MENWGRKKTSYRSYNLILELVGAHFAGSMVYLVYLPTWMLDLGW